LPGHVVHQMGTNAKMRQMVACKLDQPEVRVATNGRKPDQPIDHVERDG